jgi:transmembrane sensor
MEKIQAKALLEKYEAGKCTEQEKALLESWHLSDPLDEVEDLSAEAQLDDLVQVWAMLQQQQEQQPKLAIKQVRLWSRIAVASVIILIGGLALFFYIRQSISNQELTRFASDLPPGKNNAILTLSNGQKIVLTETNKGEIAKQGPVSVTKTQDGTIIYHIDHTAAIDVKAPAKELQYNTIATPRGGKYQLNLPDGTKVWLNAATVLKYPVVFAANERRVELTGEAYFEVSKNKQQPFHVKTAQQDVEVLGTHFNVNAYNDEKEVKTTLLEGSVKVLALNVKPNTKMPGSIVLKPNQQATVSETGLHVTDADMKETMSWKNGMFEFKNSDLTSIMRQASRWYDVDVVYEGGIPDVKFSGEVSRSVNASTFLEMLKYLDIKFNIEKTGNNRRRLVVSK